MPQSALQPCLEPRCSGYRERGSSYCTVHRSLEKPAFDGVPNVEYGYHASNTNRTFRRLRAGWLMRHPLCNRCGEPGGVLDHVKPHRGDRDLFWSQANWQTLCTRCHNRKTASEAGSSPKAFSGG
jgi:5-methylcytosine-specific restriction protein A